MLVIKVANEYLNRGLTQDELVEAGFEGLKKAAKKFHKKDKPDYKKNCQFPLVLSRIVLGPNLQERNINKEQLRLMIKNKQIRVTDDFEIAFSTIESYRK